MEQQLKNLNFADVLSKIQCYGSNVVLVRVYKDYANCHRKIVVKWIEEQAKITVQEI